MAVDSPTYGAGPGDLAPMVRTLEVDESDAVTYLDQVGRQVRAAIATLLEALDAAGDARATQAAADGRDAARSLVALGAASMAWDASYPELASTGATDTSYGSTLWDRFTSGLETLVASLERSLEQVHETVTGEAEGPAGVFPPPFFTHDQRW